MAVSMAPPHHSPPAEVPPERGEQEEQKGDVSSSDSPEEYYPAGDGAGDAHADSREDEAADMVGVSIGRVQSRMKARSTPAEEKSRVLERAGNYFDTIPDSLDSDGVFLEQITAEPEEETTPPPQIPAQAPTPAAQPSAGKDGSRSSLTKSILKSTSSLPRRSRAWSGELAENLHWKRFLPDLTSLAKMPSLSFRPASPKNQPRARSQTVKQPGAAPMDRDHDERPSATPQQPRPRRKSLSDQHHQDEPISELNSLGGPATAKHSFARRPSASVTGRRPSLLRKSSSDHSLYLRASSTASSLDQRPLYENVHSQVNSRFKAIKDSLQDSSNRLLSMPTLHLQDLRSEWGYRPFLSDVHHRKGNNYDEHPVDDLPPQAATRPRPSRTNSDALHPVLSEAMAEMTGDVVVMGGYRGSILRSAQPPHRQLWVPMKVGLNLRKVDLEVGLSDADEENMPEHIIPSGVLSHVGPVDICRRLMRRLQKCDNALNGDLRVHDYGYDWRLSPDRLAHDLVRFLESLPCNSPDVPAEKRGAIVIAHSLGGLIARHAVNQRPELFAGVLYAGVPQHCVNILGPLRNGDDVLLSSRVLTAQVNFSFRTSYALLPEDGHCFYDKRTGEEYKVDFFDPAAWDEYRLSPCVRPALPPPPPPPSLASSAKATGQTLSKRFSISNVLGNDQDQHPRQQLQQEQQKQQQQQQNPDDRDTHRDRDRDHPLTSSSSSSSSTDLPPSDTSPTHNPPMPSHISSTIQTLDPPLDGVTGPTSHIRGSSNVKATTTTTIPHSKAMSYLSRTLASVLTFKQGLAFNPSHQQRNRYPPAAVIFGKSVPTVYGARISSREQIKRQDAYDDLAFAAGDGVCLASAAMLPPGYRIIRDGLVKSDRGHVGLLGDLEGVGKCLRALVRGRREGVGLGGRI